MGTSLSIPKGGRTHSKIVGRKGKQCLLSNGELLLEKMLTSFDGKCNPLRLFSAKELAIATTNYRHLFHQDAFFKTYHGFLADRSILVRYFYRNRVGLAINEAVFASQLSSHNNILMLLGCCLESEAPILVYESAENGILTKHIRDRHQPLPWNYRLKVAKEIADAVAYLHDGLSRPIVHKDIQASCIFLDGNYVAKLSGFCLSLTIPLGEDSVEESIVTWSTGYLPPEYGLTGKVTEKIDVYYFGKLLFEIIAGGQMSEIMVDIDRSNADDQNAHSASTSLFDSFLQEQILDLKLAVTKAAEKYMGPIKRDEVRWRQLMACTELSWKCSKGAAVERPTMKEVAEELRRIIGFRCTTQL